MRISAAGRAAVVLALAVAPAFAADPAPLSTPAQQHFLQGMAYERLGRLPEAYSELQIASTLEAGNAQMALALGDVACRLGRIDPARRALEQSITLDAASVASYFMLAMIYESKGITDRALDSWHRFAGLTQDELLKQLAQKHIRRLEAQ